MAGGAKTLAAIKKIAEKNKPTQRIFRKKYSAQEGAGLDPETGRSVSAKRSVDSSVSQGGMKVTRGRESMDKGMAEAGRTAGQRNLAKTKVELQQKITKLEKIENKTASDKKELAAARRRLNNIRAKESSSRQRSINQSAANRTGQKRESTSPNLVFDRKTGEIDMEAFKKLTPRQQERQAAAAKAFLTPAKIRRMQAEMEQQKRYKGGPVKGKRNGKK